MSSGTTVTKRKLEFVQDDESKATTTTTGAARKSTTTKTPTGTKFSKHSLASPVSKRMKPSIVTPVDEKKEDNKKEQQQEELFVPKYIHKNLSYVRKGQSELDPIKQRAYEQIIGSHIIPSDLEQSRTYGPLAGSCYEERVFQAYSLGKLTVQDEYHGETRICTVCANKGHVRNECPTLI